MHREKWSKSSLTECFESSLISSIEWCRAMEGESIDVIFPTLSPVSIIFVFQGKCVTHSADYASILATNKW
jgi:hypothetical protein